jgi:aspartyl-tRNA(Asn)/glutamyl-tRNA(Gln) amidotransferase subunit C
MGCYLSRRFDPPTWDIYNMSLNEATVRNIATLARIEVADSELSQLATELSGILHWVEQLAAVDTEGVAPISSVSGFPAPHRDDVINDGDYRDRILANATEPESGFFTVPKVVE